MMSVTPFLLIWPRWLDPFPAATDSSTFPVGGLWIILWAKN